MSEKSIGQHLGVNYLNGSPPRTTALPDPANDGVHVYASLGRGAWLCGCELSHLCAEGREITDNGERTNTLQNTAVSRQKLQDRAVSSTPGS